MTARARSDQRRARAALLGAGAIFLAVQFLGGLLLDRYGLAVRFPSAARVLDRIEPEHPPDVVILGSSRFMGLRTEEATRLLAGLRSDGGPVEVCNAAVPYGEPIAQEYVLERLLARGVRPRLVIVEVSPDFLTCQSDAFALHSHRQFNWGDVPTYLPDLCRTSQLNRLAASRLVPLYAHRRELRHQGLLAVDHLLHPESDSVTPHSAHQTAPDDLNQPSGSAEPPPAGPPLTSEQRENFAAGTALLARTYRNYQTDSTSSAALERLVRRCGGLGIDVVLVAAPVSSYYRRCVTPEIESAYEAYLERLTRTSGCALVDYRDQVPDRLFSDLLHLNPDGYGYFTRRLTREVLAPHWRARTATAQR
jgi:hypothetical protein